MIKIALVAHEFGLFPGRGGIATYLYHLSKGLLTQYSINTIEVHIIAIAYDIKCDLKKYSNFYLHPIVCGGLEDQGLCVLNILKQVQPDFVESADAFAFCLESILYRNFNGKELKSTKFFVIHHTANRECFEWSNRLPIEVAPRHVKALYLREKAQMFLADCNIFPAEFLRNYVSKNYGIMDGKILRYTYCNNPDKKDTVIETIKNNISLDFYIDKFVICYISRLEERKNQQFLVESFVKFIREQNAEAYLILAGNSLKDIITEEDERFKIYKNIPNEYRKYIKFFDFVNDQAITNLCAITDLTVMASVFENFPFAMIENVYRGIPIMTSKYNGCIDFMGKYREEMSYDPFSSSELAKKIKLFYQMPCEKRKDIAETQYKTLFSFCRPEASVVRKIDFFVKYKPVDKVDFIPFIALSQKSLNKKVDKEYLNKEVDLILCQNRIKYHIKKIYAQYSQALQRLNHSSILSIGHNFNQDVNIMESLINQRIIVLRNVFIPAESAGVTYSKLAADEIIKRTDYFYMPILNEAYENLVDRNEVDNEGTFMPILSKILYEKYLLHMEDRYVEC